MQDQGVSVRQESVLRSMSGYDRVQQLTFRDGLTAIADTVIVAIGKRVFSYQFDVFRGNAMHFNPYGFRDSNQH